MPKVLRDKGPNSIIPDGEPDPADVDAAVAAVPELFRVRKTPLPPTMADGLEPGITEAPIPDPPPEIKLSEPTVFHQAQTLTLPDRPADETVPAFGTVTRFKEADLVELWWLRPALEKLFPNVPPVQWNAKLRMFMGQNNYLFVRNAHAVALARTSREEFGTDPVVTPLFVVSEDGDHREGIKLCREIVRWAKLQGASEVRDLNRHNDDVSDLMSLPKAEKREEIVCKLK